MNRRGLTMLSNHGYTGFYRDESLYVDVMLENPLDYGIDASMLVFSVRIVLKNGDADAFSQDDFTFYLMDNDNSLYSVQNAPYSIQGAYAALDNGELPKTLRGLITAELRPELLYQDMRVGFMYRPYDRIELITLRH
jgi:hypothetical protein